MDKFHSIIGEFYITGIGNNNIAISKICIYKLKYIIVQKIRRNLSEKKGKQ
jgi:hypothetical protein